MKKIKRTTIPEISLHEAIDRIHRSIGRLYYITDNNFTELYMLANISSEYAWLNLCNSSIIDYNWTFKTVDSAIDYALDQGDVYLIERYEDLNYLVNMDEF